MVNANHGTTSKGALWLQTIFLTLLAAIAVRVVVVLCVSWLFGGRFPYDTPWTFHTLWEIGYLAIVAHIVVRFGSRVEHFIPLVIFGVLTAGMIQLFLPDWFMPQRPRFYGIESCVALDADQDGQPDSWRGADLPLRGCLYDKNNPPVVGELFEKSSEGVNLSGRGFLFWQTGLAFGYSPLGISSDENEDGILRRIELFFTVGPITIIESAIRCLTLDFPILLALVVLNVVWRGQNLWFDAPVQKFGPAQPQSQSDSSRREEHASATTDSPLNELCRRLLLDMGEPDADNTLPAIRLAMDVAVHYPEVVPRPASEYLDRLAPMLVDLTYVPEAEAMWILLNMDSEADESAEEQERAMVAELQGLQPMDAGAMLVDCFYWAKIDEVNPTIP